MALNFNVQSILDNMQQQMIESKDETLKTVKKTIVAELNQTIQSTITQHQQAIKALTEETNGATVNAKTIAYHERMLDYYQS